MVAAAKVVGSGRGSDGVVAAAVDVATAVAVMMAIKELRALRRRDS